MTGINQENVLMVLDTLYEKAKVGIPKVSVPIEKMANDYLSKANSKEEAIKTMLKYQIAKCTTSGIVTGFGGLLAMPVTIPANISSVLYVQMRMIACTAYMAGYDLSSDQTQTFVYACLAGVSLNQVAKKFSVKFGEKAATAAIKKIPGKALTAINQKIGFRFATKFGSKGLINLGKMVPLVGAGINGAFDFAETKIIADRAYKNFVKSDFSDGDSIDLDDES